MSQMRIDVVTLFPGMFEGPFAHSIVARAIQKGVLALNIHDLRQYGLGKHKQVDDKPYGGGAGMVLRPEPLFFAIEDIKKAQSNPDDSRVVLLTPQGQKLQQAGLIGLSNHIHLIMICGHYEGIDERVRQHLVDIEISIGDYILTGGELAAMVLIDGITRLLPGALGDDTSSQEESFSEGLLEYPHYTRPEVFQGLSVPQILRSGNHEEIRKWREQQAQTRTKERRPDLVEES